MILLVFFRRFGGNHLHDITWNDELQVNWSKWAFDVPSGIGCTVQPIGVARVPVGLAGCHGVVRFLLVKHDTSRP